MFGLGQLVIGGFVAWRMLRQGGWRRERAIVLAAVGLWFVSSGIAELFVSGMETAQRLTGRPSARVFALWRERADGALLAATIVLAFALIASLVMTRARALRGK